MRLPLRLLAIAAALAALVCAGAAEAKTSFEKGPCPSAAAKAFPADLRVDCGVLTVPENRARPNGRTVRLAVAVVHSTAAKPAKDPILFIQGGPAAGAIVPELTVPYFRPFLRKRDVILLDQRGTGYSRPNLACPELDRAAAQSFPNFPTQPQYLQAVRACKQRLVASGVDLAAYTDADSAADIADLRTALGIDKWNLLAISAGGELALSIMRLQPKGIRSVILDSAWSNRTLWGPNLWRNASRYLDLLFRTCAAQRACEAAYPRLSEQFEALTKKLDANPLQVRVPKPDPEIGTLVREAAAVAAKHPEIHVGPPQYLPGNTTAILPLTYTNGDDKAIDLADDLRSALERDENGVSRGVVGGPALWSAYKPVAKEELARAEAYGFPITLIILLAGFATLIAAGTPLVLGFVSVFVTAAIIYWLSRVYTMSIFVTNMASMIGIGVAVDYSLFIVSRFRQEMRDGATKDEALRTSLATSGTAVVFSGATVIVAMAGLLLIPMGAVRSMAVGAMVVVGVAVLTSITLLPALLALVGANIERFRLRLPWQTGGEAGGEFWRTWTKRVLARPTLSLVASVSFLLLLASPALAISPFERALALLPGDSPTRQATEQVKSEAGAGATGPVHVIVSDRAAAKAIRDVLPTIRGIGGIGLTQGNADGTQYLTEAFLTDDPESAAAASTYDRMEKRLTPIAADHNATLVLGGATAGLQAIKNTITSGIWKLVLFVVFMAYIVLMFLLRSLILPVKAVLMNLLSVAAAYGVLVAVFQWGWLDWTGYNSPGYIDSLTPALILAITFGLSMDYEVFLLGRIKERFDIHRSNDDAVAEGVQMSARIITSAALIMIAVFGAFAVAGSIQLRQLGVGLAVAIALDATVVRLILVPSTMKLLGDWNWWMPRRIEEHLPRLEA
jgi:RND superfamily putative drug exporter